MPEGSEIEGDQLSYLDEEALMKAPQKVGIMLGRHDEQIQLQRIEEVHILVEITVKALN